MATRHNKHQNRHRAIRSAILTGSLLSVLPLFALMKSAAGDASASAGLAVAGSPAQTTSSQSVATTATTQATTPATSTATTKAPAAMTYTRTKAS